MNFSYLSIVLLTIFFSVNNDPISLKLRNDLIQEEEIMLSNLRQLTFSGENAEAYF